MKKEFRTAKTGALIKESIKMAISQKVISAVVLIITAIMVTTVLLTTGRTAGAEQAVLETIQSLETRTFSVNVPTSTQLNETTLDKINQVQGIEWVAAFGQVHDARVVSGGDPTGYRVAWGDILDEVTLPTDSAVGERPVWVSGQATTALGFQAAAGALLADSGDILSIHGRLDPPDFLSGYEPLILTPALHDDEYITSVIVVADSPDHIAKLAPVVIDVLGLDNPKEATVITSGNYEDLLTVVSGQFGTFSRSIVLIAVGITTLMTATILSGLILLRRRDYGRRRALGATRGTVILLVMAQIGLLGLIGSLLGFGASLITMLIMGVPIPNIEFFVALLFVTLATVIISGVIPALLAANRDPITELRVA